MIIFQNFLKDKWETDKELALATSWPDKGHIEFIGYSVKYRDELENVLNNINCDIKPGEKVQ